MSTNLTPLSNTQLDRLAAEKIMNWNQPKFGTARRPSGRKLSRPFYPTSRLDDALQLRDRFDGMLKLEGPDSGGLWHATVRDTATAHARVLARAITLALLVAAKVQSPEELEVKPVPAPEPPPVPPPTPTPAAQLQLPRMTSPILRHVPTLPVPGPEAGTPADVARAVTMATQTAEITDNGSKLGTNPLLTAVRENLPEGYRTSVTLVHKEPEGLIQMVFVNGPVREIWQREVPQLSAKVAILGPEEIGKAIAAEFTRSIKVAKPVTPLNDLS